MSIKIDNKQQSKQSKKQTIYIILDMKMFNVKAIYCQESDKLKTFKNGNYDNLSQKRKVEFNKFQKEIKSKYNTKTS